MSDTTLQPAGGHAGPVPPTLIETVDIGSLGGVVDFQQTLDASGIEEESLVGRLVSAASADELPGPRYEVLDELGRGGMGKVVRVRDRDLCRSVAMKVLHEETRSQLLQRFLEEAQVNGQLDHPNILPLYDLGVGAGGSPYFTMKLIPDHQTVADLIFKLREGDEQAHATYSMQARVQLIIKVCDALAYAHARGVVHRDVKPENIAIGNHGEVYLVDWGIASVPQGGEREEPGEGVTTLRTDGLATMETMTGALIGTPYYMAPEQARGEPADACSDIYSVSAVLYELLTLKHYLGEPPQDLRGLLEAVETVEPLPASSWLDPLNGRVPRVLGHICAHGLRKDRSCRTASASALSSQLQAWLEGNGPVFCPGTMAQSLLSRLSRAIDRHPVGLPWCVIGLSIAVPLGFLRALYLDFLS